jgi:hypothetical protein
MSLKPLLLVFQSGFVDAMERILMFLFAILMLFPSLLPFNFLLIEANWALGFCLGVLKLLPWE